MAFTLLLIITICNCMGQQFNDSISIHNLKFKNTSLLNVSCKLNVINDSSGWAYLIKCRTFDVYVKMKDAKIVSVMKDSIQSRSWRLRFFYSVLDNNLVLDSSTEYNVDNNYLYSKSIYKNDIKMYKINYSKRWGYEEKLINDRNLDLYYHKDFFCNFSLLAEGKYSHKYGKTGPWKYYDLSGKLIAKGKHKYWCKKIPYNEYNFQNINDSTCAKSEIITIVTPAIYYYKYGWWYLEENGIKQKAIYYKDKKIVTLYKKPIKK